MSDCHCERDDDDNTCGECGNPLGPFNLTGYCKACRAEIERERAEDELRRKIDASLKGDR
jgi:hypothetical protein